ncbi:hypothetical protein [Methylobacterium sp. ID0610]|uniref:hypothetical protein n=1 Tax=Methylobacterium carpenticola TaxID=3344827 RepID=UPI0036774DB9
MRRISLLLKLFFLFAALVAAADGWSGAPIGSPPGHATTAGRHHGGTPPWAALGGLIFADDDERSAPGCLSAGTSSAWVDLASVALPGSCPRWWRIALAVERPSFRPFLSAASPRGPPQVS